MATRSIVAAHTEKGVRGVYVHWDGYPEARIPVLTELLARDGVGKVVATIMGTPAGWSSLDPTQKAVLDDTPGYSDDRFAAVAGYGVQYTLTDNNGYVQGNEEYWTPEDTDAYGAEFAYLITEDGKVEYAHFSDGYGMSKLFGKAAV
jgi:hypothetical protein